RLAQIPCASGRQWGRLRHPMMQRQTAGGTWWRPWFAPIVVAVALVVDYTSPAELWTAALPLIFMAVLLSFRERTAALAVLLLSSWIGIPIAAGAVRAVDAVRGVQRAYVVRVTNQALETDEVVCASPTLRVTTIDVDAR